MLLLIALAALAAHHVGPLPDWHGVIADGAYNGILGASALICLCRGVLVRADRVAWLLIGGGVLAWTAADIYWTVELSTLESPPYPSISDAGWIVFYPALIIGVVLLLRSHGVSVGGTVWLDAVIAAASAAALTTAMIFPPILAMSTEGTGAAVAVNLAYPVGDLLLLTLLVLTFGLFGWRPPRAWWWIAAGLILSGVADVAYLHALARGEADGPAWANVFWPAAALATAYAAVLPRPVRRERIDLDSAMALLVPAGFAIAAFAVLVWDHFAPVSDAGLVFAALAVLAAFLRAALTVREHRALLRRSRLEAMTDGLTGLPNRRALLRDLSDAIAVSSPERPRLLLLFDLNGFKLYNDAFGHLAGDGMLARLGQSLRQAADGAGTAYRMGGDEFCVLARLDERDAAAPLVAACLTALTSRGDGFDVSAAVGAYLLQDATERPEVALRETDRRMYVDKERRRSSASSQSVEVLVRVLAERDDDLAEHIDDVSGLCEQVGRRLGLRDDELSDTLRAATLHDIGKAAIPDAILNKPGPLDEEEWAFMRRHTIIGERILLGAPALAGVARLVRASHERWDGAGYPDRLRGEEIPLGARIIATCDAYDAMITDRPYRAAMPHDDAVAELRRCAGTQFDPAVVEAFVAAVTPGGPDYASPASRGPCAPLPESA